MQVNIHEAKTHLSRLIKRALAGEEVIIAKRRKPLVRLEVIGREDDKPRLGGARGLVIRMDDDFDDPLPEFAAHGPTDSSE